MFFFAVSNKSRTRLAPTPTYISTKSEPEMEKNGTLASPATAFANNVLPVPGGPTRSTPRGIFAPTSVYFFGCFRNSTISLSSSFSSSAPATSEKRTFTFPCILARDFPKLIALFPPPTSLILRNMTIMKIITITEIKPYITNCHILPEFLST